MYDELIKALRGCVLSKPCDDCPYYDPNGPTKECATMNIAAADAIEELQGRAKVLEKIADKWFDAVPKWIPVTERLPKCNGCYLVWRPHFFGGEIGMPSICYFDGSNTWHDSYGVDFERILHPKDVTHWMPLPEPPKEAEEGES